MPVAYYDPNCACQSTEFQSGLFHRWRSLDSDLTNGRYADVDVNECVSCGQLWIRYFVEYEAFTNSGRWARGMIDEPTASIITPDAVPDFLAALPAYIYGGSYFGGRCGKTSGLMRWDL